MIELIGLEWANKYIKYLQKAKHSNLHMLKFIDKIEKKVSANRTSLVQEIIQFI